ncbi:MAG: DNA repair protein RecN [Cyanosarcina radialis HA8281-LM2]|jgi:DNA repair protein RecN (Recombination protein N)|nr:DNA repair protein RecN [Cyanosarcina radialis HA8281-LM2]
MLLSLRIENFALIDRLELEFGSGLNVLTGETGAGKSIILDAIDAALGGKVSSRVIRTGVDRASIEATFRVDPTVAAWLAEQEIDLLDDGNAVCYREISVAQGNLRSRSRVNGVLVNRQLMDGLRDRLVEITAQGQTIQLTTPARQRQLLDLYGGAKLLQQRDIVASAYADCQQALQALEKCRQFEQQRWQRLDLLEYQIQELAAARLQEPDELEQLEQERQRLSHVVDLQQLSYKVYQALYQNDAGEIAGADLLGDAEATLRQMVDFDAGLQPILDLVGTALTQIIEAGRQINTYGEDLESDPQRLSEVEERMRSLKQIVRKYGPLDEAIALYEKLQAELAEIKGGGQSLEELEANYQRFQAALTQVCQELTRLRTLTAGDLEGRLVEQLKPLGMKKVKFQVAIAPCPPASTGADRVTFEFSPNPGEPLQPLSAIASGGEMSRFLLALKACFSQVDATGTLIFDEVDAGVSGKVAQAIAEQLHQLSQRHQVLCVTHQPLIAAMADHHFRVDKQLVENSEAKRPASASSATKSKAIDSTPDSVRTAIRVSRLSDRQTRREELAQLAGGKSAPDAIAFVESLLDRAANQRQSQSQS